MFIVLKYLLKFHYHVQIFGANQCHFATGLADLAYKSSLTIIIPKY